MTTTTNRPTDQELVKLLRCYAYLSRMCIGVPSLNALEYHHHFDIADAADALEAAPSEQDAPTRNYQERFGKAVSALRAELNFKAAQWNGISRQTAIAITDKVLRAAGLTEDAR